MLAVVVTKKHPFATPSQMVKSIAEMKGHMPINQSLWNTNTRLTSSRRHRLEDDLNQRKETLHADFPSVPIPPLDHQAPKVPTTP
jgi:hypothetical protein